MKKIIMVMLALLFLVVLIQNTNGVSVQLLVWQIQAPFHLAMLCCAAAGYAIRHYLHKIF